MIKHFKDQKKIHRKYAYQASMMIEERMYTYRVIRLFWLFVNTFWNNHLWWMLIFLKVKNLPFVVMYMVSIGCYDIYSMSANLIRSIL
jgi:hypothetical protein